MQVTFVTTNVEKLREVRSVLSETGLSVGWSRRVLPEPQAPSLGLVVRAKLAAARAQRGYVMVEDSGLFVLALRGFPGVYSSFAYGRIGLRGLLRLVDGRPRDAVFRTVAGVARGARRWYLRGECRGTIAHRPRGEHGFGFDPIFIPVGFDRTFAQLTQAEKNELSHRARAFRKVARLIHQVG